MPKILLDSRIYPLASFADEEELEAAVVRFSESIFGEKTVYFDIKRKVRTKRGALGSIPDGYLISFIGGSPKLFIVENKTSDFDELTIGQQLLKYQATFKEGQYETKSILLQEIKNNGVIRDKIQSLLKGTSFPNSSELLDEVIFRKGPGYILVIDEASERLREVLKALESQPEVIEIKKFIDRQGQTMYHFSDFAFAEVKDFTSKGIKTLAEVDTIVCPARQKGFEEVFLGKNRWYAIRISAAMIPQIRYIAMYETKPFSGIRWIGYVQDIKPFEDTDKFDVVLAKKEKLTDPIRLTPEEKKKGIAPRGPRYTKMELIRKATKMSDIF
jgi:hypothetical protein